MHIDEYRSYDATGLAELVRRKQVSPDELLDTALAAVAAEPGLNAVVNIMEDQARRAHAEGVVDGPFTGVPFLVKDLGISVAGAVTTNGCQLFADAPPATVDSELVRRYRGAGLVIFGKTNTPEFGLAPSTEPVLFGSTQNPHDHAYSAGGSSGGSAAAVAAGIVPMAHASDGGGSIRIPASVCGVFGLKPSRGRVTFAPERSEGWAGMSTQHVVSRSVRDSAAALDATAGPAPGDPYYPAKPIRPYLSFVSAPQGALRVGVCVTSPAGTEVHPQCRATAETTARILEDLGHHVAPVDWPIGPDLLAAAQAGLTGANVAATIQARLAQLGRPLRDGDLEPVTAAIVGWGNRISAVDYVNAVDAMHEVGRRMGGLFESIDVLVTPTMACPPPRLGYLDGSDFDNFVARVGPMVTFTSLVNMSGQPAISLPLGRSDEGLPIGGQVIGRYGEESTLLGLAGEIERAHPWV